MEGTKISLVSTDYIDDWEIGTFFYVGELKLLLFIGFKLEVCCGWSKSEIILLLLLLLLFWLLLEAEQFRINWR
jgi:hypothetical protein